MIYCNNEDCKHNDNQQCNANPVYLVDRSCVTFKRKPRADNYRELMRPDVGICHRSNGKLKRNGG